MDADATWGALLWAMLQIGLLWALLASAVLLAERRSRALAVTLGWLGVPIGLLGVWKILAGFLGPPAPAPW